MSKAPMYRLQSKTGMSQDEVGQPVRKQFLTAVIHVPDILAPGDKISVDFPVLVTDPRMEPGGVVHIRRDFILDDEYRMVPDDAPTMVTDARGE